MGVAGVLHHLIELCCWLVGLGCFGLVLLTGVGGLTSFGQAAFVGLGAYTTAWLTTSSELPTWLAVVGGSPWLALGVGLVITAVVAVILGSLSLKLSGHYLPLGTMAWGISLFFLFGNMEFLGGHSGLSNLPSISVLGFELADGRDYYYLVWCFVLAALFTTKPAGFARRSGDPRPQRRHGQAEAMGVNGYRGADGDFCDCCAARLRGGLVVRPPATLCEPDPFRPAHRH